MFVTSLGERIGKGKSAGGWEEFECSRAPGKVADCFFAGRMFFFFAPLLSCFNPFPLIEIIAL